jgi:hypothetical protein
MSQLRRMGGEGRRRRTLLTGEPGNIYQATHHNDTDKADKLI